MDATAGSNATANILHSERAALVRALALTAGAHFSGSNLLETPYGTFEPTLLSAEPVDFSNDYPSLGAAASGPEREGWQDACDDEFHNLESHGAFEWIPEDSLPSWDAVKRAASEVVRTLWVLRQKRGMHNENTLNPVGVPFGHFSPSWAVPFWTTKFMFE